MGISCSCRSLLLGVGIHLFLVLLLTVALALSTSTNNETDRLALLEFKAKITDPLGVITNSWNSSLHFCQWYGVTCGRGHQRVTVLNLRSLKLSGSISPHVGNLSFLRELSLENNSFSHEIPPQIGHLRRLQILSLHNNSIGGQIPDNLSACSNLHTINLQRNKLDGEIPRLELMKLKVLDLSVNSLRGTVAASLMNASSLETINLFRNNLHGVLPESFGYLINVKRLDLADNLYSGTIPSSIFNLSSIMVLDLGRNQLQGTLPTNLGISLPQLRFFSIDSNQFYGSIPTSISNISNLEYLRLYENNLTGGVPSLKKLNKLTRFSVGSNLLGCRRADDLKFLSDLTNATALISLSTSDNNFGGELLPEHIANLSKKLKFLTIGENHIVGSIPAEIENLVSLVLFQAAANKLSGTIPSTIAKLKNLTQIYLEENHLCGNIPSSLGNLTNLFEINLSYNNFQGMVPPSLGNCTNLLRMLISDNNLTGPIPLQIFQLPLLSKALDLSANHLYGSLPNEVGKLKQVEFLSLSQNMLSGQIPAGLGSCTSLEFLYMDANLFQGSIPSSLSSLRGIRELSLSRNNLSGPIPEFLTGFKLEWLDISYNDFEGIVPIEGTFKNRSVVSLQGNKHLCGGIKDFGLPACKSEQPKRRLTEKLKIVISLVSALVCTALVLTSLFLWRSRKSKGKSESNCYENTLLRVSYQSLLKATNGFSTENLIGSGGFGSVYKGILNEDGHVIAVKVLNLMRQGAAKSFLTECEILRNIRHRNLVKVLTACSGVDFQGNDFKALVYEFMDNGSLDDWLHSSTLRSDEVPRSLSVIQRLNISIDVACALEYLHFHSGTPVVHCDLKPSNVLLDKEMTAHVSDFGLVKFLSDAKLGSTENQSSSIGARGTIGYCPPEYGLGSDVSTYGDIFSFGILVLAMFTGKRPTDDMFKEGLTLHNFVKKGLPEQAMTDIIDCKIVEMQMDVNATPNGHQNLMNRRNNNKKLVECMISIFEIGMNCSAESPQERMNICDVVVQLSSIRNKLLWTGYRGERELQMAAAVQG